MFLSSEIFSRFECSLLIGPWMGMSENAWAFTDEEESTRESKSEFLKNKVIKLNIYFNKDL